MQNEGQVQMKKLESYSSGSMIEISIDILFLQLGSGDSGVGGHKREKENSVSS